MAAVAVVGAGVVSTPLRADAGPINNRAPFAPTLVSPTSGTMFPRGVGQVFTINAVDPDGDPYTGTITIRDSGGAVAAMVTTSPALSGTNSSGVPVPGLVQGNYTWSAHATDVWGAQGPESGSASFSVAVPADVGAGVASGSLNYTSGIRPGSCAANSFGYSASSAFIVVNVAFAAYAGPAEAHGGGSSSCEDPVLGQGSINMTVTGTAPNGSTLVCGGASGSYTRVGVVLVAQMSGTCSVTGVQAPVLFVVAASLVPTDPGGGVIAPLQHMVLNGAVAVAPR